jgi:quercetin dioxygenase-like cupin family protein
MTSHTSPAAWIPMVAGVKRRTVAVGEKMMQVVVQFDPNATTPEHSHVHEQITYCLSGQIILAVRGEDHVLNAGECIHLASNVPHAARAGSQGAVVQDTFSPPREDMLAKDREFAAR